MIGIIISPFKAVRIALRQMIQSIDMEIALTGISSTATVEAAIQYHQPAFVIMPLPPSVDGGIQRMGQIKTNFPGITLIVMVSYDFPEYEVLSYTSGIDHLISKENVNRQQVQHIIQRVKAHYEVWNSYGNARLANWKRRRNNERTGEPDCKGIG